MNTNSSEVHPTEGKSSGYCTQIWWHRQSKTRNPDTRPLQGRYERGIDNDVRDWHLQPLTGLLPALTHC